jgi:DNA repair protein RadC
MDSYSIPQFRLRLVRERTVRYKVRQATAVTCAEHAVAILRAAIGDSPVESIYVLHLDGLNHVISCEQASKGGRGGCAVTPGDILRGALVAGASAIIIGHNHPSGDPTPSLADVQTTEHLSKACDMLGVPLLDHIVVTSDRNRWASIMGIGAK